MKNWLKVRKRRKLFEELAALQLLGDCTASRQRAVLSQLIVLSLPPATPPRTSLFLRARQLVEQDRGEAYRTKPRLYTPVAWWILGREVR